MGNFTWLGEWIAGTVSYYVNDVVEYQGIVYICVEDALIPSPPPPLDMTKWNVMVVSGSDGTNGTSGTSGTGGGGGEGTSGTSGTNGTSGTGFNTISTPETGRLLTASGSSTNSAIALDKVTFSGDIFFVSGSVVASNTITTTNFNANGWWNLKGNPITLLTSTNENYGEIVTFGGSGVSTRFSTYYWSSSSSWILTDANVASSSKGLIAMATNTTFDGGMLLRGYIYNSLWNWTVGATLYLSDTGGSGLITQTQPTGTADIVRVVGYAISADLIYFNPSQDWIELA